MSSVGNSRIFVSVSNFFRNARSRVTYALKEVFLSFQALSYNGQCHPLTHRTDWWSDTYPNTAAPALYQYFPANAVTPSVSGTAVFYEYSGLPHRHRRIPPIPEKLHEMQNARRALHLQSISYHTGVRFPQFFTSDTIPSYVGEVIITARIFSCCLNACST